MFPNIIIKGNYEKLDHMEGFDVYVRGVGLTQELDPTGRYMLFSKNIEKRFPTSREIVDKVIMLAFTYGDTFKLGSAQKNYLSQNSRNIPRPSGDVSDCPATIPKEGIHKKVEKKVILYKR